MAKLGKKARKFAKKHLQPLLKKRRQLKAMFKKKSSKSINLDVDEEQGNEPEVFHGSKQPGEDIEDGSLDDVFGDDDCDIVGDDSETDGYLSEDSSFEEIANIVDQTFMGSSNYDSAILTHMEVCSELEKKRAELKILKQKDHGFSKFLEDYEKRSQISRNEGNKTDDDETSEDGCQMNGKGTMHGMCKLLTSACVDSLCQLVSENHSTSAFTFLLNVYRAICLNKLDEVSIYGVDSVYGIQNGETSTKIFSYMLYEADNFFRVLLGIANSKNIKAKVLELKNSSEQGKIMQLLKSYLRSNIIILNESIDPEILAFIITRLRVSVVLFTAFPSLLHSLIKVSVHLWITSKGYLSSHSFLLIRDVASLCDSRWFHICLVKMYKAFISHCRFVEPALFEHKQYLRHSFAELCSLDVQKSSVKVKRSLQELARILKKAWLTKNEEEVKKITSWKFINCIDLCSTFISRNACDYDLQPQLSMIIQIINGVAILFPGPRYFPMRLKCIKWLNYLSKSSGVFIPVISLVLDMLEYKISKEGGKMGSPVDLNCSVKVPKYWLRSKDFQKECVLSVLELLAEHFAQWSYHISFPELATIPLVRLRKFCEITTKESNRRIIKRFLDQVEQNVEFVRKRRDEVIFSPKDQQSAESFLGLEKDSRDPPFLQYYKNNTHWAVSRKNAPKEEVKSIVLTLMLEKKIKY